MDKKCFLCLKSSKQLKSIKKSRIGTELLENVIDLHFWFLFDESNKIHHSVCLECYTKLETFHLFCLDIHEIHRTHPITDDTSESEDDLHNDLPMLKDLTLNDQLLLPVIDEENVELNVGGQDEQKKNYASAITVDHSDNSDDIWEPRAKVRKRHLVVEEESNETKSEDTNPQSPRSLSPFTKNIDQQLYPCEYCGEVFTKKKLIELHTFTMHHENIHNYKCSKCPEKFYQNESLAQHTRALHDSVVCDQCGRYYRNDKSYKEHLKLCHGNRNVGMKSVPKMVKCNICKEWFRKFDNLITHMRTYHIGVRLSSTTCMYCDLEFTARRSVRKHEQTVHEIMLFNCDVCREKFSQALLLKEHMATHTGDFDLYQCNICTATSRTPDFLNSHMKQAHNKKEKRSEKTDKS